MNSRHRKILESIFKDPVNGTIEWAKIESLFVSIGCRMIEGSGSAVTFEKNGIRAYFHRPHTQKDSLKYRVKAAREFLVKLEVEP